MYSIVFPLNYFHSEEKNKEKENSTVLTPKLNATCVYTFPETVKVDLAIITSLTEEADLRNMYSAKIRTHPLKI